MQARDRPFSDRENNPKEYIKGKLLYKTFLPGASSKGKSPGRLGEEISFQAPGHFFKTGRRTFKVEAVLPRKGEGEGGAR